MSETTANIKQILTSFETVMTVYENHHWVKTVTSEDIKIAFKLGSFVEKVMLKFSEQNCVSEFLEILKKNARLNYEQSFYLKMCDQLLFKFFKHKSLNENVIEVAIRMYTSLFPKERLQIALKDLILTTASFEAILEFTEANKANLDVDKLKYKLVLGEWSHEFQRDQHKITIIIEESLSSFKVESSLPILMGVLTLNVNNSVTQLILDKILDKMLDRSILTKDFWLALLKKITYDCLCQVCMYHHEFLESFCNFLIYTGGMMESDEELKWVSNSSISLCPEVSYNELESIFISLCKSHCDVKEYVINKLNESYECTSVLIWETIKNKCL